MYAIQNLTSDPLQNMTLILYNGNPIQFTIYFVPQQYGWFITNLQYGSFTLNGLRITNSPNFLQQWKNILPFGMGCYSTQNSREPSLQQDFSSGANVLFLLDDTEVDEVTEYLENG
jgi:hypothetical protein